MDNRVYNITLEPAKHLPASPYLYYLLTQQGRGVSLVVLPEYHLTGLVPDCPAFVSPRFKSVGLRGSKSFGHQPGTLVTTDPNSLIRKRHSNYGCRSVDISISSGTFAKRRPATHEPQGSSRYSVIKTPLGQVGLVTFPEAFRAVTCQGARIIIIPGFWLNTEYQSKHVNVMKILNVQYCEAWLALRGWTFKKSEIVEYQSPTFPYMDLKYASMNIFKRNGRKSVTHAEL
ncbi:conserved hypothetical protein [Histoplasma capsulatum G186AR]|uniref:Uncharacterized protein n=1 Tax=Ajellomyces capsulatus (strain G186AR / H82 / ATCC MYA-2454 / RMSCC 2432) TaxID=447093 RepID=C0NDQ8_AJECG|nr:uncharacterized protein HCBG_02001 [Histoplasma capsulatum G186AR]EEH10356.1 conserved hypothetical protein [Histoplasma capsulatum G186AR]